MLVGRAREMARLAELLDAARQGRSGVLVLRGEPGVGKSALLGWAREQATGFLVLSARGTQSEVELAYAGLADLFRPGPGPAQGPALKAGGRAGQRLGDRRHTRRGAVRRGLGN